MARTRKKGNPIVSAVVFGIFGIVLLFIPGYTNIYRFTRKASKRYYM